MLAPAPFRLLLGCALALVALSGPARPADWPAHQYDAGRTAATPHPLPADLHLHWVRQLPPPRPAWPDQAMMRFDEAYAPVAVGKTLFVAFPLDDTVTAFSTETGAERWHFTTDGPVRFPPLVWEGRAYFVSDDGHLYCLDAGTGGLHWKFRGGPADRRGLGNGRLVSTWPARGGPAIADGTVYFAASIWPFMGVFLHALDARTGQVKWTNDGDGSRFMKQPHQADSFAAVAPQGNLVVVGDNLLVPGGRSVPACYDRHTGQLRHFLLADNSKSGGGSEVAAAGRVFVNGGTAFETGDGKKLGPAGTSPVLCDDVLYSSAASEVQALDLKTATVKTEMTLDRKALKMVEKRTWVVNRLGSAKLPGVAALIKAGPRLYAGTDGEVAAIDLPLPAKGAAAVAWRAAVEGKAVNLLAADDRLFVATLDGKLYCFGPGRVVPTTHGPAAKPREPGPAADRARAILEATNVRDGYAVVWGVGPPGLVAELARRSALHLIVVEPDAGKVAAARAELRAAGLYGDCVAVHHGDPLTFNLPPYLAGLMVADDPDAARIPRDGPGLRKVFESLRPYGGVAHFAFNTAGKADFARALETAALPRGVVREAANAVLLTREGALPGAANWTHEHADAANTRVSRDQIVRAPLGVLWFGGSSHDGILPRHGHGPQPQVVDGRLFIEGVGMLRCMDIYTGRILWETSLPGVGAFYDNTAHQPGANAAGTNFISTPDGVYVLHDRKCLRLDPATGKKTAEFRLPGTADDTSPEWGYVNVVGDYLIGGTGPEEGAPVDKGRPSPASRSSSRQLSVLDRHSGAVLWTAPARDGFRHNAMCAGGGRLYAADRPSGEMLARLKRRGESPKHPPRLVAFDLKTGREVWHADADVFGTWLSYSEKHDVLVEAGRVARDTLTDEPKGMRAYRAGTGAVLWNNPAHIGPAMIRGDLILKDRSACDLLTGAPHKVADPLTGELVEWAWTRMYGCNTPAASEHLLTFRSGAAGYFDLTNDGGTGNLGGFRSSCTNNLIVAGGLLTAPDYTRTCTCSYQNQTSIAFVHMPEAEMWTYTGGRTVAGPVRRLGLNLGAPGSRKADDGTLWLEYPAVGGPSPKLEVKHAPEKPEWFRRHSTAVHAAGPGWVGASGAKGLESLTVTLADDGQERTYTVRLHFAEPDGLAAGKRLFHVTVKGKRVLESLDVSREAGGPGRGLVKEIKGIKVVNDLTVSLTPADPAGPPPVLCGVEVLAEGW